MIILYITLVLIFLLIIFKLIKEHTHVLPQEVYAIEKYFSIFKKEYIYRM